MMQPPPPPPPPPQQQQQQQQQSPSSSTLRSLASPAQSPAPLAQAASASHRQADHHVAVTCAASLQMPARVRLSDMAPYDGATSGTYVRAVEALSGSLARHNAAIVELGCEDAALMRCGLEAARLYFRTPRPQQTAACAKAKSSSGHGVYVYRAGRTVEDWDSSPPCMVEIYRCMGKVARAALCTIARHLRLRSDAFNHLLDDAPLPANDVSSSVLVATYCHTSLQNGKGTIGRVKPAVNGEVEKGLLTLVSSDNPGLQVCDPNGRWYIADCGLAPGDLLLITGKALTHATAGLHHAAVYKVASECLSSTNNGGRTSLAFRLMPQSNAILDCSPIAAAGHVISQSYVPISVSQFMDDLSAEEDIMCSRLDDSYVSDIFGNQAGVKAKVARDNLNKEPSLRSVLSDPLSGAFLEDAMVVSCGHSFGGLMLRKVLDMSRCTLCSAEIVAGSLIPNLALRAAAEAIKHEDERRLFHNAALRKRRKELGDQTDINRRSNGNGNFAAADGLHKGVQYPFSVNEKVIIKGNRRTPEKFVGKEAIVTSQCLNGWYLLKIIGSGENVRLQYRSLQKILTPEAFKDGCVSQPIQSSST